MAQLNALPFNWVNIVIIQFWKIIICRIPGAIRQTLLMLTKKRYWKETVSRLWWRINAENFRNDFLIIQWITESTLHQQHVMTDLITFMHIIGNLFLAAVILSALIFTTFYYIIGHVMKEIKLTPLRKGISFRRRWYPWAGIARTRKWVFVSAKIQADCLRR